MVFWGGAAGVYRRLNAPGLYVFMRAASLPPDIQPVDAESEYVQLVLAAYSAPRRCRRRHSQHCAHAYRA